MTSTSPSQVEDIQWRAPAQPPGWLSVGSLLDYADEPPLIALDLRKIKDVKVDKATKTVVAGGGCIAGDVESACEAEGLMVPFGVHWETGTSHCSCAEDTSDS